MNLFRLLVVTLLTYGIPFVLAGTVYKLSESYITNTDSYSSVMIVSMFIYLTTWFLNTLVFENAYDDYLSLDK